MPCRGLQQFQQQALVRTKSRTMLRDSTPSHVSLQDSCPHRLLICPGETRTQHVQCLEQSTDAALVPVPVPHNPVTTQHRPATSSTSLLVAYVSKSRKRVRLSYRPVLIDPLELPMDVLFRNVDFQHVLPPILVKYPVCRHGRTSMWDGAGSACLPCQWSPPGTSPSPSSPQ